MKCRHCQAELTLSLVDLGSAPPSNSYLRKQTLHAPEKYFPLRVLVCAQCWLVQTEYYELKRTRSDYVLILPWNLRAEVTEQLEYIREWGGKFVTAVPVLEVI